MARVCTYLNFPRQTEEAFTFYRSIFGGDFAGQGIARFGDTPPQPGMPSINDADKKLVMHIELVLPGGHVLMGTDAPESMGFSVTPGNNVHILLDVDSRAEADLYFKKLSNGGTVTMPMGDVFWGAYYGSCVDKYRMQWMVNYAKPH